MSDSPSEMQVHAWKYSLFVDLNDVTTVTVTELIYMLALQRFPNFRPAAIADPQP